MEHKGTKRIETERLILRRLTTEDAEGMFNNWASDAEVTKYLTWPTHKSVEVTKSLLEKWVDDYQTNDYYQWCIELKEIGQPIGSISAVGIDESVGDIEIGYCIGRKFWNKGITTEAFKAVIDFFFNEVGANRISGVHDVNNPSSGRVMEKCGLKYEGRRIKAARNQQGICDVDIYGLVKEK